MTHTHRHWAHHRDPSGAKLAPLPLSGTDVLHYRRARQCVFFSLQESGQITNAPLSNLYTLLSLDTTKHSRYATLHHAVQNNKEKHAASGRGLRTFVEGLKGPDLRRYLRRRVLTDYSVLVLGLSYNFQGTTTASLGQQDLQAFTPWQRIDKLALVRFL